LLGDTNQAKAAEPKEPKAAKEITKTSNWKRKETRATFIVNEDLLEK
jgi:hypothetical protein